MRTIWKIIVAVWKWLVGAALCTSPWLSVIAVGWTYRLMQRQTLRTWNRFSPSAEKLDIGHWPNWLLRQRPGGGWLLASLWANIKTGVQAVFNTWVLTMPACVLWAFAWRLGWDLSFYKVYEQSYMGPALGWLGNLLFIAAMFYVPLAQARQAVTGDWRSFYHFGLVWRLVRRSRSACIGLAAAYTAVSFPIMLMRAAPFAIAQSLVLENRTNAEIISLLQTYYFVCTLLLFPLFVFVRLLATRVYARSLLQAVTLGVVSADELGERERTALGQLGLLRPVEPHHGHILLRAAGWAGSRFAGFAVGFAAAVLWFTFVAQVFVGEFLNHHPLVGWLNVPLVQLPVIQYIPGHLYEE